MSNYGITEAQYDELLNEQDEKCWLCQRHWSEFKINLAVDHNHKTGELRGLLCAHCNHRLIGRHTDPDLVERMSQYLRKSTGLFVPLKKKTRTRKRKT